MGLRNRVCDQVTVDPGPAETCLQEQGFSGAFLRWEGPVLTPNIWGTVEETLLPHQAHRELAAPLRRAVWRTTQSVSCR